MHATCSLVLCLALRSAVSQLTPTDPVQLQPVPLQLNSPREDAAGAIRRNRMPQAAPATYLDETETSPPRLSAPPAVSPTIRAHQDSAVRAVQHQAAIKQGHVNQASQLLLSSLTPLGETSLVGRPLRLVDVLRTSSDRARQMSLVRTYWKLLARLAEYQWAVKETVYLSNLPAPTSATDIALHRAATTDAAAREAETRLNAIATQNELAETLRMPLGELPLPADLPLVSPYRTAFESIFARRQAPEGLRRVVSVLPNQQELIEQRAAAAFAAEELLQACEQGLRQGQVTLPDILQAADRASRQRQLFLAAVRDYNYGIAEYSLSVIGPEVNHQQLVATLIRTAPNTAPAARPAMAQPMIRPTTGEQPLESAAPRSFFPNDSAPRFAPQTHDGQPANVTNDPRWRTPGKRWEPGYETDTSPRAVLQSPDVAPPNQVPIENTPIDVAPAPLNPNDQPPPRFRLGD